MDSILFHRTSRKIRNRVNSKKLFEFDNFAVPNSMKKTLAGAFRDNVRVFLQNFAEIEEYTVGEMTVWSTLLFSQDEGVFPLYTVEETAESSPDPFCNHCEAAGWGHHFVCQRKYHFIIPEKENWNLPLDEIDETHCHYLYGLIHCNGYGHIIRVNGLKNNSNFFSADDTMEFWDRLCTVLKARYISARHVSRKEAIELSLIHGAAYGKSWFEKWGYKFSGGSPGITEQKYGETIQSLGSLNLDSIVTDLKNRSRNMKRIKEMIDVYRKFSGKPLFTITDLLRLMLVFESRVQKDVSNACKYGGSETGGNSPMGFEKFVDSMTKDCRWPSRRLENVLYVIVGLLKEHRAKNGESGNAISRQELRDGARKSIGDTGLIDYVLKSIKCFTIDNLIIRRAINPYSKLAEFIIQDQEAPNGATSVRLRLGLSLSRDIRFLYENVLSEYIESHFFLTNNYHFVKEWTIKREITKNNKMELTCKVLPSFDEMETELTRRLPPGEVVVVDPWITIGELRVAAQWALRDTYCVMDEFEVTQIGGLRRIEDEKVVYGTVGPGSEVWVRGRGFDFSTVIRYEDEGRKSRG
ncbi:hypothetical protein ABFS83_05G050000 [Erythranthe nasuta]